MQLEIRNLSLSKKNKKVLENVSFLANEGDFICILGENGAGKSTLLNCICRILKVKNEEILVNGQSVNKYKNKKFASIVSFVPQNYNPIYECTVTEFLLMGRNPYKSFGSSLSHDDIGIVNRVLEEFSMEGFAQRLMSQLSGGERKKILLMRALVQDTDIIVLDEPTNQLDFGMRVQFMNTLKRLANKGKIIIMTTHLPDDAINYSNKTIVVFNRETSVYGTNELKEDVLGKIYSLKIEFVRGNKIVKTACISEE